MMPRLHVSLLIRTCIYIYIYIYIHCTLCYIGAQQYRAMIVILQSHRTQNMILRCFMASVEECISERECKLYDKGLNSKVKLSLYRTFSKNVGFKMYLHRVSDAGGRHLFKFRSVTHGLNEELGRHRGREGKVKCTLCGAECKSIVHVLWECPAYSNCRLTFLKN